MKYLGLVVLLAACQARPAAVITSPTEGETVAGPAVRVTLNVSGVELVAASEQRAGTAHHHLFFDVDPTPAADTIPAGVSGIIHLGRAQTEFTFDSAAPGPHRIIAVLADPWHVPLAGATADTVNIIVR